MNKPEEKNTGEPEPPKLWAQRMPAYKNCAKLADEDQRKKCTETKLIKELGDKLWNKNINKVSGIVYVTFVVNTEGSIIDVKVLQGIDPHLDREVVKAVQSLNGFEPGNNNGIPANVRYNWPVSFTIKN